MDDLGNQSRHHMWLPGKQSPTISPPVLNLPNKHSQPVLQPLARRLPLLKNYIPASLRSVFGSHSLMDDSKMSSKAAARDQVELAEQGRGKSKGFAATSREITSQDEEGFASTEHLSN